MSEQAQPPFTSDDEAELRESLKRCPAPAVEAAVQYRRTGDVSEVPTVILGILARFVEPDIRPKLEGPCDEFKVLEDLGIDSLTMVEVVMMVEETLALKIDNQELQNLRTIGDIKSFIQAKLGGGPAPVAPKHYTGLEINDAVPHDHPFLFLEEAALTPAGGTGKYTITGKEFFLDGHFKDRPVFPASLMLEALGQLAVFYLLRGEHEALDKPVNPESIYFLSADGVRCSRICKPGDVLSFEIKPKSLRHPVASFEGTVTVEGEKTAFAEAFSLSYDFADKGAES